MTYNLRSKSTYFVLAHESTMDRPLYDG